MQISKNIDKMKLKILLFALTVFQFSTFAQISTLFAPENSEKWVIILADKSKKNNDVFSFNDGVLKVGTATAGYIRTKKSFKNYTLKVDWRWTKKAGNSGVLLHIQQNDTVWPVCFQVQQKADAAGDIICMNGLWANECTDKVKFTVPKKNTSNEKPIGEWNSMEVICKNGTLTVFINNLLQNKITGMTKTKGYIGFQAEGCEMEFRKLEIKKIRN
jgi:hypothetical protein